MADTDITYRLRQEFRVRDWWPGMDSFDSARGETVPHPIAHEAASEIEALRGAIQALVLGHRVDESRPFPWMIGSTADEAYHRALGRDSGRAETPGSSGQNGRSDT